MMDPLFTPPVPAVCAVCGAPIQCRAPTYCADCGRLMCRDCACTVNTGERVGRHFRYVAIVLHTTCKDCRRAEAAP